MYQCIDVSWSRMGYVERVSQGKRKKNGRRVKEWRRIFFRAFHHVEESTVSWPQVHRVRTCACSQRKFDGNKQTCISAKTKLTIGAMELRTEIQFFARYCLHVTYLIAFVCQLVLPTWKNCSLTIILTYILTEIVEIFISVFVKLDT